MKAGYEVEWIRRAISCIRWEDRQTVLWNQNIDKGKECPIVWSIQYKPGSKMIAKQVHKLGIDVLRSMKQVFPTMRKKQLRTSFTASPNLGSILKKTHSVQYQGE